MHNPPAYPSAHPNTYTITALDDNDSTIGLIYRFNEHLHVLHATTAERQEWEDELALRRRVQAEAAQWVGGPGRRAGMSAGVAHVV
jgi:hypothetical protein